MTDQKPVKSYAKHTRILAICVVGFCVLYAAGWFFVSHQLSGVITKTMNDLRGQGTEIACDGQSVSGFPFRIGLFCDMLEIDDQKAGISFASGALRTTAVVYNPKLIIAELDGPANMIVPNMPPLMMRWQEAGASIRPADPLPERISMVLDSAALQYRDLGGPPLGQAERIEFHMRGRDGNLLDIALVTRNIIALQSEPFALNANLTFNDQSAFITALQSNMIDQLRGQDAMINALVFRSEKGGSLTVSGPIALALNGGVNAVLTLEIEEPEKLASFAQVFGARLGFDVAPLINGLNATAMMGTAAPITVTISDSQVRIGFIPLGAIGRF